MSANTDTKALMLKSLQRIVDNYDSALRQPPRCPICREELRCVNSEGHKALDSAKEPVRG